MSKKLERSRDEELEEERKLENKIRYKFESNSYNEKKDNDNKYRNLKIKEKEDLDSESDEYYEEEDEESGEIEDDDDEINSEFKKMKKKKLEVPIGKWSRKKSDIIEVESCNSLSSADIIINNPENKNDKKNLNINKEKSYIDSKAHNLIKKANFFTTPIDISGSGKNNSNEAVQKNMSSFFSVNNDINDSKNLKSTNYSDSNLLNNNLDINLSKNDKESINTNNVNNENKGNSGFLYPSEPKRFSSNSFFSFSNLQLPNNEKITLPQIFNKYRLSFLIREKLSKFHLRNIPEEKVFFFLQDKLKEYLKIYILRLITISRIRNVNFNLYSNNPNGHIHYKFKTYNWSVSKDSENVNITPAKGFDILFTSNYKRRFDLIDEYVELNNKKTKFEKLSSCKEKFEESNKAKGIESSIKITDGPNPTIKLLPGRRTKKKNNNFFKEMRKKIVQTKKKEDLNKQKSFTKSTLDTFLNDNINNNNQTQNFSLTNLIDGGSSNNMEMSSKMSDTMSHNNLSYNNTNSYMNNSVQNEIHMNIFTYFDPTKDGKIYGRQKKRINLKDFIFLLENSNEYIPNKLLLLNKAAFDFSKNK